LLLTQWFQGQGHGHPSPLTLRVQFYAISGGENVDKLAITFLKSSFLQQLKLDMCSLQRYTDVGTITL
jgi:hypothetical protein